MPRRFARASSSRSRPSSRESGFGLPSSRNSAFLDRMAAFSNVPPMPTPRISGGHASGPADFTHSMMKSFTAGSPAAGVSIVYFERFPRLAGGRGEHRVLRAVLAAAALGHDHDAERGPRRDLG